MGYFLSVVVNSYLSLSHFIFHTLFFSCLGLYLSVVNWSPSRLYTSPPGPLCTNDNLVWGGGTWHRGGSSRMVSAKAFCNLLFWSWAEKQLWWKETNTQHQHSPQPTPITSSNWMTACPADRREVLQFQRGKLNWRRTLFWCLMAKHHQIINLLIVKKDYYLLEEPATLSFAFSLSN